MTTSNAEAASMTVGLLILAKSRPRILSRQLFRLLAVAVEKEMPGSVKLDPKRIEWPEGAATYCAQPLPEWTM